MLIPIQIQKPRPMSPFLELSAELRNRIYWWAVVVHDCDIDSYTLPIRITGRTFPEPPLLRVCRQIREEASPVFYGNNEFIFEMNDYDSTPLAMYLKKFPSDAGQFPIPLDDTDYGNSWMPNRPNLYVWAKRVYEGVLPGPSSYEIWLECDATTMAVGSILFLVEELKDLPWSRLEPLLDNYHALLHHLDRGWV